LTTHFDLKNTILIFATAFVFFFMLTGCTVPLQVRTDLISDFEKSIKLSNHELDRLIVKFYPREVQFMFNTRQKMDETKAIRIFRKTKEFFLSDVFQKEVMEEIFFKKYGKKEKIYPDVSVSFILKAEKPTLYCRFHSSYYATSDLSSEKSSSEIDGYRTWYYRYGQWNEPLIELPLDESSTDAD